MHARILPLIWKVLSDLRYSKLKRILKVYEYNDKEKYSGKRMRGELYSEQGKRQSNLPSLFSFYFSYFSLFNFPFLSIFLRNLVIIIGVNQCSNSYKKNGVGDCMHSVSPSTFIHDIPFILRILHISLFSCTTYILS